jgi:hypothetical protein
VTPRAEVVSTVANCVVMRFQWRAVDADADGERYQVVRLRDGKIREMAEYRTVGEATKAAKRLASDRPSH